MQWFDPKFHDNRGAYIAQTTLAALVMFFVLHVLNALTNAATIAALGATSFIAFTMPHANASRPRYLLGGYAVGLSVGFICHFGAEWAGATTIPWLADSSHVAFAAVSLGVSIFLMVVANFEHPPAASLALGLVLGECSGRTILVIVLGITILTGLKTVLKPALINLL